MYITLKIQIQIQIKIFQGRIQYREAGDLIDCTRMGVGGKAIPPYIDQITDIVSDAQFVILGEYFYSLLINIFYLLLY